MFAATAVSPRTTVNRSGYCYGPYRFRLSQMDVVSRRSSDFADDTTAKVSPTSPPALRPKKRLCYGTRSRDAVSHMTAGLKTHFDEAKFSDLVIRCRDEEYHAHRIIMCSHSQWFAKACAKAATESQAQTIDLSADSPDAVDAMIQYCYQLDYADRFLGLSSAGYIIYTLIPHIDVYLLACRYDMPGLKQLAVEKFEARAAVLSRVDVNKEKFFQAIRVIYASTCSGSNDELRTVAVKLCADHSDQYILQGGRTAARVFKLMDEITAFRTDFVKELASRLK